MAVLLRDAGYEVTVITFLPNYPTGNIFPEYSGRLIHREVFEGIKVVRLWLSPSHSGHLLRRGMSLLSQLLSITFLGGLRLLFRKTDLVIVSSPPLANAWLATLIARMSGRKVLVNISDIWPLTALEMGAIQEGRSFKILQRMERQLYQNGHAFMGQSEEILAHIRATLKAKKPGFLYRNLQEQQVGTGGPEGKNESVYKLIYAGNLGHAQGMLELCRAIDFAALGVTLTIYGAGAERSDLEKYIHLNPQKGIQLYPTIPQKELDHLLKKHDAVLVPLKMTIRGAVPSKLFMAIAAGLPVLFCAGGEGEKLVREHHLGWVAAPGDHKELAKYILQATHSMPEESREMKENIRQAGKSLFSKKVQDKAFVEFIGKLIADG